jgi:hypothetical protein
MLLVNRSYARTVIPLGVVAIGVFEFYAKIWYGDEKHEQWLNMALTIVPSNYTIGEALRVFRKMMPLLLQFILLALDNSFDVLAADAEESLEIITRIVLRQDQIIADGKKIVENINAARVKHAAEMTS